MDGPCFDTLAAVLTVPKRRDGSPMSNRENRASSLFMHQDGTNKCVP